MKFLLFFLYGLGMLTVISCSQPAATNASESAPTSGPRIAFVHADSILHNYVEFKNASDSIDAKQHTLETDLRTKGQALQEEILEYQRQAQSGSLSRVEMQSREQELGKKQDDLMAERDEKREALIAETSEINRRLLKLIRAKLEEIRVEDGYDYILSFVEDGPVLAANPSYDITPKVLQVLNDEANKPK